MWNLSHEGPSSQEGKHASLKPHFVNTSCGCSAWKAIHWRSLLFFKPLLQIFRVVFLKYDYFEGSVCVCVCVCIVCALGCWVIFGRFNFYFLCPFFCVGTHSPMLWFISLCLLHVCNYFFQLLLDTHSLKTVLLELPSLGSQVSRKAPARWANGHCGTYLCITCNSLVAVLSSVLCLVTWGQTCSVSWAI